MKNLFFIVKHHSICRYFSKKRNDTLEKMRNLQEGGAGMQNTVFHSSKAENGQKNEI